MDRRKLLIVTSLLLAIAVMPWGVDQGFAQSKKAVGKGNSAAVEHLRERAERVQAQRKARVTHTQRKAAAERAKAAGAMMPISETGSPSNVKGGQK